MAVLAGNVLGDLERPRYRDFRGKVVHAGDVLLRGVHLCWAKSRHKRPEEREQALAARFL